MLNFWFQCLKVTAKAFCLLAMIVTTIINHSLVQCSLSLRKIRAVLLVEFDGVFFGEKVSRTGTGGEAVFTAPDTTACLFHD